MPSRTKASEKSCRSWGAERTHAAAERSQHERLLRVQLRDSQNRLDLSRLNIST